MELIKAEKLAKELMTFYGLDSKIWKFQFDNAKRRFGVCKYNRLSGVVFNGIIGLSRHLVLLNDEKDVRETILHEIAHALTPGHSHDSIWRRQYLSMGGNGNRCYSSAEVNTIPKSEHKYLATCGGCGKEFGLHKMTEKRRRTKSSCHCQRGISWDKRILLNYIDTKAV